MTYRVWTLSSVLLDLDRVDDVDRGVGCVKGKVATGGP